MTSQTLMCVERRRHERRAVDRACKLLHAPTMRYMAAQARDISDGGVLLEVSHHRELAPGDRVELVVDWAGRGIVRAQTMVGATVVRVGGREGLRQRVGLAFDRAAPVASAA